MLFSKEKVHNICCPICLTGLPFFSHIFQGPPPAYPELFLFIIILAMPASLLYIFFCFLIHVRAHLSHVLFAPLNVLYSPGGLLLVRPRGPHKVQLPAPAFKRWGTGPRRRLLPPQGGHSWLYLGLACTVPLYGCE